MSAMDGLTWMDIFAGVIAANGMTVLAVYGIMQLSREDKDGIPRKGAFIAAITPFAILLTYFLTG